MTLIPHAARTKPVVLKAPFDVGYIEIFYTPEYSSWMHFTPDPRKLTYKKPKFWWHGNAAFGSPEDIMWPDGSQQKYRGIVSGLFLRAAEIWAKRRTRCG